MSKFRNGYGAISILWDHTNKSKILAENLRSSTTVKFLQGQIVSKGCECQISEVMFSFFPEGIKIW